MDNRPIGVFDSGLGGLNGLCALRRFLPDENIVYFADSGRLPYGAKSRPQLREMAKQDLRFLSSFNVKAILIACARWAYSHPPRTGCAVWRVPAPSRSSPPRPASEAAAIRPP